VLALFGATFGAARPAQAGVFDWFVGLFEEDVKETVAPNVNTTGNDHVLLGALYAKVLTDLRNAELRTLHKLLRKATTKVTMEDRRQICAETGGLLVTTVRVSPCSGGVQRVEPEGLPAQAQRCASGKGDKYFPACVYVDARGLYHWDDGPSSPPELEVLLPGQTREPYKILFWVAGQLHDYCYHHGNATYGFSKAQCDDEFYEIMKEICKQDFPGVLNWFDKKECDVSALTFYKAVVKKGQSAFEATNTAVDYKWALPLRTTERRESRDARRLRDYDGDRRADLLCHDRMSGAKWIDLAEAPGTFRGTNWSTPGDFCRHADGRLFKGDFDGDGRADLLCHDVRSGRQWVSFADAAGRFDGTDWSQTGSWCGGTGERLLVGDFDGDRRDDLLCHGVSNGKQWIAFAKPGAVPFSGTDWHRSQGFCGHATGELHVGDFNADGRDDLLCHDVASGAKWIDYADGAGHFQGTDWQTSAAFCGHATGELHVGDFDGDLRDDLLCHDVASGAKWIDHADAQGAFGGTDLTWSSDWCAHVGAQLWVGDVSGDGADDLVCHDVRFGTKWVDVAWPLGGTDWTDTAPKGGFCGHAAGELH
jgi:hypothetical protein